MKIYLTAIIVLILLVLAMYGVRGTSNDFTEAAEGKRASQFDGLIQENAQR